MIPDRIVHYLQTNVVPYTRHWHARAITAQELAHALHVSGKRVAKTVVVEAGGTLYLCVLPGTRQLDEEKLAEALNTEDVRLADEALFARLFPDCELGAEPPFGRLYNLPVILDSSFSPHEELVLRAGSHEETLEIAFRDFVRMEHPMELPISRLRESEVVFERPMEPAPPAPIS